MHYQAPPSRPPPRYHFPCDMKNDSTLDFALADHSNTDRVCLVGEVFMCATAPLETKTEVDAFKEPGFHTEALCEVIKVMLRNRAKYGFISNYSQTIFLTVEETGPFVMISEPIPTMSTADVSNAESPKININLALLYVFMRGCSKDMTVWRLSSTTDDLIDLGKKWLNKDISKPSPVRSYLIFEDTDFKGSKQGANNQ
ncbi:hypothetical protein M011DRAFT_523339 [Sporormia fimetaria CBS 119925]|uniref:Uncharacterized protein n=1 Tax=Sporormia fimetaria CBS 119925 TaxID=1340428 RepID=A0A6A6VL42_9PLEO|nr:hypothetical protein M011DRAFT_523339 [Sporormia fimetaria CBS 119925]